MPRDNSFLQKKLGYIFVQPNLLRQALTHRSFSVNHYERLEFLGDGVLNFIVAHCLFDQFPEQKEGDLSRIRAHLVRQETLVEVAQKLDVAQYLYLGDGELKSGGLSRPSILADVVEAIFGAIFCDGSFDAVNKVVKKLYAPILQNLDPDSAGKDPKTQLQERLQAGKIEVPKYEIRNISGAAHEQLFTVTCDVSSLGIHTSGTGVTRRLGEQSAALLAISQLESIEQSKKRLKNKV